VRTQISAAMIRKFREQTQDPEFVRNMQHELLRQGEFHAAAELRKSLEKTRKAMDDSPSFYHVSRIPSPISTLRPRGSPLVVRPTKDGPPESPGTGLSQERMLFRVRRFLLT
jgi:hypothetical protein